jgi:hypothetical protein
VFRNDLCPQEIGEKTRRNQIEKRNIRQDFTESEKNFSRDEKMYFTFPLNVICCPEVEVL